MPWLCAEFAWILFYPRLSSPTNASLSLFATVRSFFSFPQGFLVSNDSQTNNLNYLCGRGVMTVRIQYIWLALVWRDVKFGLRGGHNACTCCLCIVQMNADERAALIYDRGCITSFLTWFADKNVLIVLFFFAALLPQVRTQVFRVMLCCAVLWGLGLHVLCFDPIWPDQYSYVVLISTKTVCLLSLV